MVFSAAQMMKMSSSKTQFICVLILSAIVYYYYLDCAESDFGWVGGKGVLVTGASSGIGEEVAYEFARLGARLVITARRTELLIEVAKKCQDLGAQSVLAVSADMASPEERARLAEVTLETLGGLDVLVLNHALQRYALWSAHPANLTTLRTMMEVNFLSYVDVTSRLLEELGRSQGYVAVVSSVMGKLGAPGLSQYAATKHALQGFFSSLRQELTHRKSGVSVTSVVFGWIDTQRANEIVGDIGSRMDIMAVAATPRDAAQALLKGVLHRKREIYYPIFSPITVFLHNLFPEAVELVTALFIN